MPCDYIAGTCQQVCVFLSSPVYLREMLSVFALSESVCVCVIPVSVCENSSITIAHDARQSHVIIDRVKDQALLKKVWERLVMMVGRRGLCVLGAGSRTLVQPSPVKNQPLLDTTQRPKPERLSFFPLTPG